MIDFAQDPGPGPDNRVPDVEATRQHAFRYYEEELARKNRLRNRLTSGSGETIDVVHSASVPGC